MHSRLDERIDMRIFLQIAILSRYQIIFAFHNLNNISINVNLNIIHVYFRLQEGICWIPTERKKEKKKKQEMKNGKREMSKQAYYYADNAN